MGLQLDRVVPWGRSFSEYRRMFALTDADLQRSILDCGGGPASFNAELTQLGGKVVSCDPVYAFSAGEIRDRIERTFPEIVEGVKGNLESYVWTPEIPTPEALGQVRMQAMERFLQDFPAGLGDRYRVAELPNLPFADNEFDLALCSHLLFTYSDLLSLEFHLEAIAELLRVAREVRIFPLLNLAGERSPWLERVIEVSLKTRKRPEAIQVKYEFQVGGNEMLRLAERT